MESDDLLLDLANELISASASADAGETEQDGSDGSEECGEQLDPPAETEGDLINGLLGLQNPEPGHQPAEMEGVVSMERPLTHEFGDPDSLKLMGNPIQRSAFSRYLGSLATLAKKRNQLGSRDQKHQRATAVVLENYVWSSKVNSIASVAESSQIAASTIKNTLLTSACLLLNGTCWMAGTLLHNLRQMFFSRYWKPLVVVNKFRYDETPLRLRVSEWNEFLSMQPTTTTSDDDGYRFAKIFRIEWELSCLVQDQRNKFRVLAIPIPTALNALERNTTACLESSLVAASGKLPGYQPFIDEFPVKIRMACVDRFGSNLAAEREIQTQTGEISAVFTCDIHKISGSMKRGFSILDNSLSGIVNLGLALEAAGSLSSLRTILQQIFDEELTIIFDNPPQGGVLQHRLAVLDLCCPLHQAANRRYQGKTRQRRFFIQSLANSDITKTDICHYCSFACCESCEKTKFAFKTYLT